MSTLERAIGDALTPFVGRQVTDEAREQVASVLSRTLAGRELTYPDEWLRGWAAALLRWPGAKAEPLLAIEHRSIDSYEEDETFLQGAYDRHHHKVYLYPDDDRGDALATLVHEYAHAWTPHVPRNHHPAAWRATYIALVYHLCGYEFREAEVFAHVREMERRHPELKIERRGDSWKSAALDIAITSHFNDERLQIDRVDGPGGHCIRATCGARVHLIDVLDQHAST